VQRLWLLLGVSMALSDGEGQGEGAPTRRFGRADRT
jgi:hypothetical protein